MEPFTTFPSSIVCSDQTLTIKKQVMTQMFGSGDDGGHGLMDKEAGCKIRFFCKMENVDKMRWQEQQ